METNLWVSSIAPGNIKVGDVLIYHESSCTSYTAHASIVMYVNGSDVRIACHSAEQWNKPYTYLSNSHPYFEWLQYPDPVSDTTPPTISAFSVTPLSVTLGNSFTISYTVSDAGGSFLKQIELWRARDDNNNNDPDSSEWMQIGSPRSLSGNGPTSGSFSDAPSSTGAYWYGIHVLDNAGNMSVEPNPPGPIKVTVQAPCPTPGTPSSPSPSSGATGVSTSPTLSWAATSNTDSYDVYFGTTSNPPYVGNTTGTSYPRSGLSYNTPYYWKIVPKNNCGNSTSGAVWSFTTLCPTPGTPGSPSPSNGATGVGTSPTLSWAATSNTDSYDVYFGTTSNPPFVGNTTGTSYPRSG